MRSCSTTYKAQSCRLTQSSTRSAKLWLQSPTS